VFIIILHAFKGQNKMYVNAQIFTVLNSKPEAASQDIENDSNCWMDQSVTLEEQGVSYATCS